MSRISVQRNLPGIVAVLVALTVVLGWATPAAAKQALTASFPAGTPALIVSGSAPNVPIAVPKLPRGGDVLVIAWSEARNAMVPAFAHELRSQPWRITARQLEKLPDGRNHVQLLTRVNGRVQSKVEHVIEKVTVVPAHYPVSFGKVPGQHTIGEGQPVSFTLPRGLPPQGDVLVQAWHLDQNRLVPGFAHTLARAPFQVTAARLDTLPPGRVELQVMVRSANKVLRGDKVTLTIAKPIELPGLDFVDAPASYTVGSGKPVALGVDGELPNGAQLVVQAWDDKGATLVNAFTHVLNHEPFAIDGKRLDMLPTGTIRLQAVLRYKGEVRQTAAQTIQVVRPPVEPVLPTLAFTGAPTDYEIGSGRAITVAMDGQLEEDCDVIVLAWSDAQKRMIGSFAQTFTRGPITIPAAKIESLPPGEVQLQAMVRHRAKIKSRVTHDFTLRVPAPEPEPEPVQATVAFAPGSPAAHTVGSGAPVYFNVNGALGEDEDVLVIAWSTEQNRLVNFNRRFVDAPYRIEAAWLDSFPSGAVQLQLLLRRNNVVLQKVTHWVLIVRPDAGPGDGHGNEPGDPETPGEPGTPGDPGDPTANPGADQPDDGNGNGHEDEDENNDKDKDEDEADDSGSTPEAGWTQFVKADDTRVIYVAANGSDENDGLSPSRPVKTPEQGYSLIRHMSADWLLFRRGDTFDLPATSKGEFREWRKSGRSETHKLVVGAYGDESKPRPVLNSNNRGVISVTGSQSVKHVAFVDLHFYANRRDPGSRDFDGGGVYEYGLRWNQPDGGDLLFEGVLIEYFANNISMGAPAGKTNGPKGVTFRRCVIRNAYSHQKQGHSQGAGFGNMDGLTFDQCIFDRNGYEPRVSASKRTWFNHGVYLYHTTNTTVANCVFSRNGFGGVKGRGDREGDIQNLVVRDSVFTDEIVGLYVTGDNSSGDPNAMVNHDVLIKGNLFTRIGGEAGGAKHGYAACFAQVKNGTLEDNLMVHKTISTNWPAIELETKKPHQNYLVKRNVVHEWPRPYSNDEVWVRTPSDKTRLESNLAFENGSIYVDANRTMDRYSQAAGYSSVDRFCDAIADMRKGNWPDKLTSREMLRYFREGFTLRPAD